MFNPYKYRYAVTFLQEEGEDAVLQIQNGQTHQNVRIPRALLPKEVSSGQAFTMTLQPRDIAKTDESEVLKALLQDLIK